MDAAIRARMFELYYTTKQSRGTGLGLCIVQGIVRQARGEIIVRSEVGHGTTFEIFLPAASDPCAS
jgi:signal transduction histidine kinase